MSFESRWRERAAFPTEFVRCGDASLPIEAAPYLTFEEAATLPRLWEVHGPPGQWTDAARERVGDVRMLGADSGGNPICLGDRGGVWRLDHEDDFQTREFVNSSVTLLAECLLAFLDAPNRQRFLHVVCAIDLPAAAGGAFWRFQTLDLDP